MAEREGIGYQVQRVEGATEREKEYSIGAETKGKERGEVGD